MFRSMLMLLLVLLSQSLLAMQVINLNLPHPRLMNLKWVSKNAQDKIIVNSSFSSCLIVTILTSKIDGVHPLSGIKSEIFEPVQAGSGRVIANFRGDISWSSDDSTIYGAAGFATIEEFFYRDCEFLKNMRRN